VAVQRRSSMVDGCCMAAASHHIGHDDATRRVKLASEGETTVAHDGWKPLLLTAESSRYRNREAKPQSLPDPCRLARR